MHKNLSTLLVSSTFFEQTFPSHMTSLVFLLREMFQPGFYSQSPLLIISLIRLRGKSNPFRPLAVILYLLSPIIPYFAWGRFSVSTSKRGKQRVVDNEFWRMTETFKDKGVVENKSNISIRVTKFLDHVHHQCFKRNTKFRKLDLLPSTR